MAVVGRPPLDLLEELGADSSSGLPPKADGPKADVPPIARCELGMIRLRRTGSPGEMVSG